MKINKKIRIWIANITIVVVLLISYFILDSLFSVKEPVREYCENMNNLQSKAVDILVETNKLLVSLSLLVIGVMGSLVIRKYEISYSNSILLQVILILGMVLSSISIFFGYNLYIELTNMLSYNYYDIDSETIIILKNGQFICFLASVIFGIIFLINHTIIICHEKN